MTLLNRAQHARKDFLGVCTTGRAIAAADLARDDRGTPRLLGAPIRRIDGRVEQKGKDRRVIDRET